jgi:hypothetical protein
MNPINYNAPWHTLTHACVGSTYDVNFYSPIKNSMIRESLQKIAAETEEDYLNLIAVLESFQIKVSRPLIDPGLSITDFTNHEGKIDFNSANSFTLIPRPPMQPRDSFLVIGDKILLTNQESTIFKDLLPESSFINHGNHSGFDAPLATVVGDTVILDCRDHNWLYQYFVTTFPEYKIKPVYIGGHNDAVYSLVKPGVIISTHHHSDYSNTFPGWAVKQIENQSWNAIPNWRKIKHSNRYRWWVPDDINNIDFSNFINTWLTEWVGHVHETVFDVNMLQINSTTVLVNNYNQEMFNFLKTHGIDAIVCPFRHRFFWDGGLHCITNDLYRIGEREHYV